MQSQPIPIQTHTTTENTSHNQRVLASLTWKRANSWVLGCKQRKAAAPRAV